MSLFHYDVEAHDRKVAKEKREMLRDQFAMAALTGILMNDNLLPANNELVPYRASGMAYEMADAMLEARKEKK